MLSCILLFCVMLYIYTYTHTHTYIYIYIYNAMASFFCHVMSFNYQNHACVAGGRVVAAVVALVAGGGVGLVV